MKWYIAIGVLALVCLGFYFKIFAIDPLALTLLCVVLWNNHVLMGRQQAAVDVTKKSHEVVTANQKTILGEIKNLNNAVRQIRRDQ